MKILAWPARKNADQNPYQKLLYDAVAAETHTEVTEFSLKQICLGPRVDILHVHWPDSFLAITRGWRFWPRYAALHLIVLAAKLRGTKLIWTAHNMQRGGQAHARKLDLLFWPWFLRNLDGVIFMTRASETKALERFPVLRRKPRACIPHGDYSAITGPLRTETTPIEGPPCLLFFGSISRYKNAFRVLEAVLALPPGNARLEIRGKMNAREPDERLAEALRTLPEAYVPHVVFEDRFLEDDALVEAIRHADLTVFPYSDVLNSGAAIFSLSAGRPLLASENDLFRELRAQVGEEWVMFTDEWENPAILAQALAAARTLRETGQSPDLSAFDWSRIGLDTANFYRQLTTSKSVFSPQNS